MLQQELVRLAVRELTAAGINYMLTGSTVSSMYGERRATHDVDIVISLNTLQIPAILKAFSEPDFYVSDEAIRQAIKQQKMFNVIDLHDADKLDFWILKSAPYDQICFSRRVLKRYMDFEVVASTPEDSILTKLRWAKECGKSEKQFGDVLRVYETQFAKLDKSYLEHWVTALGLESLWKRLLQEARVL